MSYTLIERRQLTSNASTISFDNIPQFYSDLMLVASGRTTYTSGPDEQMLLTINNSTSNFSARLLFGTGSSTSSSTLARWAGHFNSNTTTANSFSNFSVYFPNYSGSTNKSYSSDSVYETNATEAYQVISAGLWSSTDPITSIALSGVNSGNILPGSSVSLYGINRQQAIGRPKAVGGNITFANGYWVHTFNASGTFYALENIQCQYLVIGGGGTPGYGVAGVAAGGGGAGGYRSSVFGESSGGGSAAESPLAITFGTGSLVTVGAGGAGGSSIINNGTSSTFGSITSLGGGGGGVGFDAAGNSGGSGAGGNGGAATAGLGGAGTVAQGFAGGRGSGVPGVSNTGAGGGGAGQVGFAASGATPGNGGSGVSSSITGSNVTRAGGGGGGASAGAASSSIGGAGGGGNGARGTSVIGTNGSQNTGGGGGSGDGALTSNGGSGIVIIRYPAN